MIYIIGSGPAGVSAAAALVDRGCEVTMLDAGFELEPERAELVRRLQALDKKNWDSESVSRLKENVSVCSGGVDLKCIYGSDYPYRGMDRYQPVQLNGVKMIRSLARGGLSTVWGGSIMPYCQKDICDWPITIEELEPHYRAVISLMKQSGNEDALNAVLPLNGDCYPFRLCRQADALLRDLDMSKAALEAEGVMFGRSRLAVAFEGVDGRQGCSYCGMCIYGCPYDLIYSAASTMDRLSANQNFRYQNGVLVEKLAEAGGEIKIQARSLYGSEELEFHGDRVFLAAGVLSSTRILLRSLDAFNRPLVIRHSEHFQLPLIRYRKTRDIASEELHTMTQVYIEIQDGDICDHMIHMQVYAYNDLYDVVMKKLLGPVAPLLKCPIEEILGRLLIIKGYLHSSCSSHIVARLEPGRSGALVLEGRPSDEANDIFRKIKTKLLRNRKYFRAVPSPKMAAIGIPGTGNHSGGSFPMRKTPAAFETDTLGRPCGFEKVHVVDATVFPSIPATTILLSIMANAHRIASAS